MNVYFACSITGGRQDELVYQKLVAALESDGHLVPTALLASPDVMPLEGVVPAEDVYARDVRWITECDFLLAEVSTPSHGVGYEIGYALSLGKRVLCLYRNGRKVSKMILGNPHSKLSVQSYEDPDQAVQLLTAYLENLHRARGRMKRGVLAGIGAYTLWGLFPIYWRLLEQVPAIEILAHRIIWSFGFVILILVLRSEWRWTKDVLHNRRTLLVYTLAAVLLSINWFTYIWAVNAGFVVEASLGYFINPLVNFLLGVIFFGEKLRRGQLAAVLLAVLGVVYLTVSYGSLPWIALVLAFTFGMYGLIKKTASLESLHGFSLETAVLFLPALGFLLYRNANGVGAFMHQEVSTTLLLVLAGPVTSIPLLLFGFAARTHPPFHAWFYPIYRPQPAVYVGRICVS